MCELLHVVHTFGIFVPQSTLTLVWVTRMVLFKSVHDKRTTDGIKSAQCLSIPTYSANIFFHTAFEYICRLRVRNNNNKTISTWTRFETCLFFLLLYLPVCYMRMELRFISANHYFMPRVLFLNLIIIFSNFNYMHVAW